MEKLINLVQGRIEALLNDKGNLSSGQNSSEISALMNVLMNLSQLNNQAIDLNLKNKQLEIQSKAFEIELKKQK